MRSKQANGTRKHRLSPQSQLWTREERIKYLHACLDTNFDWKQIHAFVPTKSYKQCRDRLRKLICQEIDSRMRECPTKNKDSEENEILERLIIKYVSEEKENLLRLIVKCTETNRNQSCFKGNTHAIRRKHKIKVANSIAKSFGIKPIYTDDCFESYLESKSAVTSSTLPMSKRARMTSKKNNDMEELEVISDTDSISWGDNRRTPARKKMRGGNVTPSPTNISKPNEIEVELSDSDDDSKVPMKVIDLVSQLETPNSSSQIMVSSHINKPKLSIPLRGYGYPFKLVVKSVNHDSDLKAFACDAGFGSSSSRARPFAKDHLELTGTVQYAVESLLELKRLTVENNPHFFQY